MRMRTAADFRRSCCEISRRAGHVEFWTRPSALDLNTNISRFSLSPEKKRTFFWRKTEPDALLPASRPTDDHLVSIT